MWGGHGCPLAPGVQAGARGRARAALVPDPHRSPGTGESHFTIKVVSAAFAGKSRLERHRMVNRALAAELAGKIHALAVTALAPDEVSR